MINASASVTSSTVSTFFQDRQVEQYQPEDLPDLPIRRMYQA